MSSTVLNVTFDCADPGAIARFWAAVTGWAIHEEGTWDAHEEYSVGPPAQSGIRLYFVGDQPADVGWVILADPEGNEFCVEGVD